MSFDADGAALRHGFLALNDLSDEQFDRLAETLREASPGVYRYQLVAQVRAKHDDLSEDSVASVLRMTAQVLASARDGRRAAGAVVRELEDPLAKVKELGGPEKIHEVLVPRLQRLVELEPLRTTVKAADIFQAQDRVFREARFLTDVRPLFTDGSPPLPQALMLTQTLAIGYRQGDLEKTFFVTLDTDDMRVLREALDRADAKAEAMRANLPTGIPYLAVERPPDG